jgi:cytochrome c-type biogenesis protein
MEFSRPASGDRPRGTEFSRGGTPSPWRPHDLPIARHQQIATGVRTFAAPLPNPIAVDFSNIQAQLGSSPLTAIPLVFLAGVLTSLTPCIYPMIPITAAIVGGAQNAAGGASRSRTLGLTLAYVIGLALVYSTLGLVAGLSGSMFGEISTNPWLYFGMANVLLLAALSMLDVLPIRLPSWLLTRATTAGQSGGLAGAFVMGAMSGLVAAPCGAPVMASVLTWVATTKSAVLGFVYLFVFSLGMCSLLVVVGLTSGASAKLPRSGAWMLWIKRVFAVLMIGVAEYYLIEMGKLMF